MELFLPFQILVYILVKGNPIYLVVSQSGGVVSRLERLFVVGGFRVVCILNTLAIYRVIIIYIFIENPIYLCASQFGGVVNQLERLTVVDEFSIVCDLE